MAGVRILIRWNLHPQQSFELIHLAWEAKGTIILPEPFLPWLRSVFSKLGLYIIPEHISWQREIKHQTNVRTKEQRVGIPK